MPQAFYPPCSKYNPYPADHKASLKTTVSPKSLGRGVSAGDSAYPTTPVATLVRVKRGFHRYLATTAVELVVCLDQPRVVALWESGVGAMPFSCEDVVLGDWGSCVWGSWGWGCGGEGEEECGPEDG